MVNSCVLELFEGNTSAGNNIFHEIAMKGSLALLLEIRDKFDRPTDHALREWNGHGETCLHLVALMNRGQNAIRMIDILVELGADLNAKNHLGHTLLHYALENDDCELINWLLLHPEMNLSVRDYYDMQTDDDCFVEESEEEQEEEETEETEEEEKTRVSFSAFSDDLMDFESDEFDDIPRWIDELVSIL
ncbi:GfV-B55'-ORF1 [Ichnoviriform fumiferanae]|uniref:GfV-B55'-ORF1 n=1 Tax=Ichnoviriform fumiferanae TaxID=419435 RepID=A3KEZ3_9VIRU|nr:GfV-B55'-ORF1 [Ichnoviriform fumiferanae]